MRHAFSATASLSAALAPFLLLLAPSASAQTVDVRVDRLEKEMKAVQRKVFPAGTPLEAEVTRPTVAPQSSGSSAPVADLMARVTALESQMASMTGQIEQNSYKLKQLEDAFAKYKAETEPRLMAPDAPPVRPTVSAPVDTPVETAVPRPVPARPAPAKPTTTAPAPVAVSAGASEERKTAVAAIERPSTGDAPGDAYNYGYRLWEGKFYPEAQTQLKSTVEKYGTSPIASKAQNLLGRAYLDDGKPALASVAFYENYQKRPRGERAPDSLAYLGEALIQLKKPADACKVYAELQDVYGATLSASLKAMADKGRVRAKCSE